MSIHKSLVLQGKLKRHRNVLSRSERLALLSKEGKWKEADSVFNLLKVKNIKHKAKAKVKKEEKTETAVAGATPTATPTAGQPQAKPAEKEKTAAKK